MIERTIARQHSASLSIRRPSPNRKASCHSAQPRSTWWRARPRRPRQRRALRTAIDRNALGRCVRPHDAPHHECGADVRDGTWCRVRVFGCPGHTHPGCLSHHSGPISPIPGGSVMIPGASCPFQAAQQPFQARFYHSRRPMKGRHGAKPRRRGASEARTWLERSISSRGAARAARASASCAIPHARLVDGSRREPLIAMRPVGLFIPALTVWGRSNRRTADRTVRWT